MRSHRRIRSRRFAAAVLASLVAAVGGPAAALAVPADTQYPRPVPETTHPTPSDFAGKLGDTPAEFDQIAAPVAKVGDTPADYPGASRAAKYDPPRTITVVRPERTIVRDADTLLPTLLASLALLVALGIAGTALVHQRSVRPGRAA
jgi:hypothetical protein